MEVAELEKYTKRRINEFEVKLKKMQHELAKLKSMKRGLRSMRKQHLRVIEREADLTEVLENLQHVTFNEETRTSTLSPSSYTCRKPQCKSTNTLLIETSYCNIIKCEDCNGRYTLSPLKRVG